MEHLNNTYLIHYSVLYYFRSGTTVYMDTWYVIKVDRRDRNITLTLNGKLVDSSQSPGSYVELNVNRDVFIGRILVY